MTDARADAPAVIQVSKLCTSFGSHVVHADISFNVRRAEIFALIGGSGSGKSTLLREMILLHRPNSGSIRVLGVDLHGIATSNPVPDGPGESVAARCRQAMTHPRLLRTACLLAAAGAALAAGGCSALRPQPERPPAFYALDGAPRAGPGATARMLAPLIAEALAPGTQTRTAIRTAVPSATGEAGPA